MRKAKIPQPQKRNATTFVVPPGKETRGNMIGFRPVQSLEVKIDAAVKESGLTLAAWLEAAAIAYLENGEKPRPSG